MGWVWWGCHTRLVEELTIRAASIEDASAIRSCVAAAYALYVDRIGKPPAPMLDDYAQMVARDVVQVAVRGEAVVGLIVMWLNEDHLYVDNIAVHPAAQAGGIGAALLAEADAEARRSGVREIRLYTNTAMIENLAYYSRKGFSETHRATDAGYERIYFSRFVS